MGQTTPIYNHSSKYPMEKIGAESILNSLPPEFMAISQTSWIMITTAAVIFFLGSLGNIYAVFSLRRFLGHTYCSMHHFLLHMCYSELLVVFFTIPLDITWRLSIGWYAGNTPCKVANFVRCFIYILNSLVLISMSIDCFWSVYFPNASKSQCVNRVRALIFISWFTAFISSLPKFFLSYVAAFPDYASFMQCLQQPAHLFFTIYPLVESYFAPLIAILLMYTPVFFRVCRQFEKATTSKGEQEDGARRAEGMQKVQVEGVKITFAFALVVILCYTPQISLIIWQYLCPNFRPNREDWLVYFVECSKSALIPTVYILFKGREASDGLGGNQLEISGRVYSNSF